jgi:hypothetical protein
MAAPDFDAAEKVQDFCDLLRATNPMLESETADLERLGRGLGDAESRLSLDLNTLATEVDGLQKEAETSGLAAAQACQVLGQAAEAAKAKALAGLENSAAAAESQRTHELTEKATALGAAFQELRSSGWEPLMAALASEHGDFERWTQGTDEALSGLVHLFAGLPSEVEHDLEQAAGAAKTLTGPPLFDDAFWNDAVSGAEKLVQEGVPSFCKGELEASQELGQVRDELVKAVGDDSNHVRGQLDLATRQLAAAVDGQAGGLAQALQQTEEALSSARVEFERVTVLADQAQPDLQTLSELAGQVPEAEALLQRIRAVAEAMAE